MVGVVRVRAAVRCRCSVGFCVWVSVSGLLWSGQPSRLAVCIIAPISPQTAGPNYGVQRLSEGLHTHGSDTAIGFTRSYPSQCDDKSGKVTPRRCARCDVAADG